MEPQHETDLRRSKKLEARSLDHQLHVLVSSRNMLDNAGGSTLPIRAHDILGPSSQKAAPLSSVLLSTVQKAFVVCLSSSFNISRGEPSKM